MPTRATIARTAILGLATLVALAGCGTRKELARTYTKDNVSPQQLLEDKALLKRTDGVVKVITHLDDRNTARIELYMKEKGEEPAVRQILDLGYQQVRN
jgi:hypothetical protein